MFSSYRSQSIAAINKEKLNSVIAILVNGLEKLCNYYQKCQYCQFCVLCENSVVKCEINLMFMQIGRQEGLKKGTSKNQLDRNFERLFSNVEYCEGSSTLWTVSVNYNESYS